MTKQIKVSPTSPPLQEKKNFIKKNILSELNPDLMYIEA